MGKNEDEEKEAGVPSIFWIFIWEQGSRGRGMVATRGVGGGSASAPAASSRAQALQHARCAPVEKAVCQLEIKPSYLSLL